MNIAEGTHYRKQIIELLASQNLPYLDLPEQLDTFLVALDNDSVIGAGGLEIYGNNALLRSVAVHPQYRKSGIAASLLSEIELLARKQEIAALILLTETAAGYFERKGFTQITRDEVPDAVKQSSEFSNVCPQSATVMYKPLNPAS